MERTQPFIILTGLGKTHIRGNEINEINPISNLLKNLLGNPSFIDCHHAPHKKLFSDTEDPFTVRQQILSGRVFPIKPALSWGPFKLPPPKDMEMQMKDTLPRPASRICHDPISTVGNSALPGHLGTDHHQLTQ